MPLTDLAGPMAGAFVILAFYCTGPRPLRCFAIASNVLFIFYAFEQALMPIAILHLTLLPLNLPRLRDALRD